MPDIIDDREQEKPRRCLRCLKMFLSANAGNRMCPACTSKPPVPFALDQVIVELDSIPSRRFDEDA